MRILLVALTVAACMKAQPAKSKSTEVDRIFAAFNTHTPGCAVGVSDQGTVALRAGYGMADLERAVPVNADTVFESGSERSARCASSAAATSSSAPQNHGIPTSG